MVKTRSVSTGSLDQALWLPSDEQVIESLSGVESDPLALHTVPTRPLVTASRMVEHRLGVYGFQYHFPVTCFPLVHFGAALLLHRVTSMNACIFCRRLQRRTGRKRTGPVADNAFSSGHSVLFGVWARVLLFLGCATHLTRLALLFGRSSLGALLRRAGGCVPLDLRPQHQGLDVPQDQRDAHADGRGASLDGRDRVLPFFVGARAEQGRAGSASPPRAGL